MTIKKRAAGILAPLFSLSGAYGIGTLGEPAYRFVDFLKAAGQSYWQVLPLNPTSYGDSPYQSPSSFAGNPYFIDPVLLAKEGLLSEADLKSFAAPAGKTDYGFLYTTRPALLKKAFASFKDNSALEQFKTQNAKWLADYCLFAALKEENPSVTRADFDEKTKRRDPKKLTELRERYQKETDFHAFLQYCFFKQWTSLKKYANQNGIRIVGDIPIYVAADSADVWANPGLFELDKDFNPRRVAGCPPDAYAKDGQLWGNPLFDWEAHQKSGYAWWIERLAHNLKLFDVVRIDHFRGFESFYAIPYGDKTAKNGVWVKGPAEHFIRVINEWFNFPPVIAEDLGFLTKAVGELLKFSGYPGMRVLEFGFAEKNGKSEHLPHNYPENCIAYSGTHDNDTARGYYENAPKKEQAAAKEYLGITDCAEAGTVFARAVLNSVAVLAVIPLADYLNKDSAARVNVPAVSDGNNWKWRFTEKDLSAALAKKIRKMTELSGRI